MQLGDRPPTRWAALAGGRPHCGPSSSVDTCCGHFRSHKLLQKTYSQSDFGQRFLKTRRSNQGEIIRMNTDQTHSTDVQTSSVFCAAALFETGLVGKVQERLGNDPTDHPDARGMRPSAGMQCRLAPQLLTGNLRKTRKTA